MKSLPKLDDEKAMAARGRRSVLMSARNEACEALRDAAVAVQTSAIEHMDEAAQEAIAAANRVIEIAMLWRSL